VATASSEIDEIRRKMGQIRRDLHEDVKGVVEGAEEVSDWRHYIRMYPWAAVGAALALGYVIVPKRKKPAAPAQVVVTSLPQTAQAVKAKHEKPEKPEKKGRGLIGAGLGMLVPVALKAAQNYATHYLTNWIAQQQEAHMAGMMAEAGMTHEQPRGPSPGFGVAGGPTQYPQGGGR
jgi:hypothetical protein